jgi:23S rRNA (pseudouridine1915-N3)-methyltransferase
MRLTVLCIGKTSSFFVREGLDMYHKRLVHYTSLDWQELPDASGKGTTPEVAKTKEGESLLKRLKQEDYLVILDERGKQYTSVEWSVWMQQRMNASTKHLVLAIGGAHGFSEPVYARAQAMLALSKMTLPHDLVRLFLAEQLYRCHTLLKGEKYHHE